MIFGLAALAVWIYALVDAIRVPDDSMYRAGNKLVRVLVIVFAQLVGAIIHLAIGRPVKGASSPGATPASPAAGHDLEVATGTRTVSGLH